MLSLALATAAGLAACGEGAMEVDAGDGGGTSIDAAHVDAAEPESDAADLDAAPEHDAVVTPDEGLADRPDATVPERCNRFDEDGDGDVDEAACRACRTCDVCTTVVRPNGSVLALCPLDRLGLRPLRAWTGVCETVGAGYRLADLDDTGEALWLSSELDGGIAAVGLRAFGREHDLRDSTGRARDEAELLFDPDATTLPSSLCFALAAGGLQRVDCAGGLTATHIACEAPIAASLADLCVPHTEACDGVDEDCDGRIDEAACGDDCGRFSFVDHVYTTCPGDELQTDFRARCQRLGGDLVVVDSYEEHAIIAVESPLITGRSRYWVGFAADAADAGGAVRWFDGRPADPSIDPWFRWRVEIGPTPWTQPGVLTAESGAYDLDREQNLFRAGICESPFDDGP